MTLARTEHLLVFGASGAIGSAICEMAVSKGWQVTGIARALPPSAIEGVRYLALDPLAAGFSIRTIATANERFTSVCWAQGMNLNDSVRTVERESVGANGQEAD